MAASPHSLTFVPMFSSAKAAEVILSEVRPTSIGDDALRAVNILLDEILWLILSHARSFNTTRIKGAILKTIPTQLGKDAILEAELELRAYRDKMQKPMGPTRVPDEAQLASFPLVQAFEFIRVRCQVLSSFGEVEEDPTLESYLLDKLNEAALVTPPEPEITAPAALYATAVIEHICQHILAGVAGVVARDSSRTTADLSTLYNSLCEDTTIYSLFKIMKVHDYILAQVNNSQARKGSPRSQTPIDDPLDRFPSTPNSNNPPSSYPLKQSNSPGNKSSRRPSGESIDSLTDRSNAQANSAGRRSGEKNRVMKMFRANGSDTGPSSEESGGRRSGPHRRSDSVLSETTRRTIMAYENDNAGKRSVESSQNDESSVSHFDELLGSGGTMKVSLTPDRLKSFEVFEKEKSKRVNRSSPPEPDSSPDQQGQSNAPAPAAGKPFPATLSKPSMRSTTPLRETEVIEEGDEEPPTPPPSNPPPPPRARTQSLAEFLADTPPADATTSPRPPTPPTPVHSISRPSSSRRRAQTIDKPSPPTGYTQPIPTTPTPSRRAPPIAAPNSNAAQMSDAPFSGAFPKRNRTAHKGPARNRESIDLDDLMRDDDDPVSEPDEALPPGPTPNPSLPRRPIGGPKLMAKEPYVSASAREFMDFLNEGPAETATMASFATTTSTATATANKPTSRQKTGRLMSMVSRLKRGGSTEKLPKQNDPATFESQIAPSSYIPTPPSNIPRHRSAHNLQDAQRQQTLPPGWMPRNGSLGTSPGIRPNPLTAGLPTPVPIHSLTSVVQNIPPAPIPTPVLTRPVQPMPSPIQTQNLPALGSTSPRRTASTRKPVPALGEIPPSRSLRNHSPLNTSASARDPNGSARSRRQVRTDEGAITPVARSVSPSPQRAPRSDSIQVPESTTPPAALPQEPLEVPTELSPPNSKPTMSRTPPPGLEPPSNSVVSKPSHPPLSPPETPAIVVASITEDILEDIENSTANIASPPIEAAAVETLSSRASHLRKALARAQTVEESRMLVDIFLVDCGVPLLDDTVAVTPTKPEPEDNFETLATDENMSLIELLLGDGPFSSLPPLADSSVKTVTVAVINGTDSDQLSPISPRLANKQLQKKITELVISNQVDEVPDHASPRSSHSHTPYIRRPRTTSSSRPSPSYGSTSAGWV